MIENSCRYVRVPINSTPEGKMFIFESRLEYNRFDIQLGLLLENTE